MKRHFANMVFALILIAYTVYAALDTFVIVRVLTPDTLPTATAEASTAPTEPPAEQTTTAPISTDTEYHDDQIDIVLTTMRVENTTVYVADVQIADISLLKTALAGNTYARNLTETTSVQAANAGAILAINGDYYGAQERGYVLRNGVLYRASATKICFNQCFYFFFLFGCIRFHSFSSLFVAHFYRDNRNFHSQL